MKKDNKQPTDSGEVVDSLELTPVNVGVVCKWIRENSGVTQTQLAAEINKDFKIILRTERGENSPSFDNLYAIVHGLGYKIVITQ